MVTLGVTVLATGGGIYAYYTLQGNITAADVDGLLGSRRPIDNSTTDPTTGQNAQNILVMGSDTRALADGTGDEYGGEIADPGARSDTTVLVHLAADRRSATLVNIPRDSMVQLPGCERGDGTTVPAKVAMFDTAFSEAGPACTIRTVEALTGTRVDHYVVVDFSGFRGMVDALGGVTICTPVDIDDTRADLHLSAGTHPDVDGETALAYARVRYSLGDGSDIERISRQQALMSSMVQKLTSTGTLARPDRLYAFLDAATASVTTDPGLADLVDDVRLAQSLQKVPADGVRFLSVPTEPYPGNPARVQWTSEAPALWDSVRADTVGSPPADTGSLEVGGSTPIPTAPVTGRVASDDICA
ncbi:MAG: LCP family protein [Janthinobacterium lividum]